MKSAPLLSIYVPAYNHGEFIKSNLDFMAKQIREIGAINDIEIAISDNASTDNTAEEVKSFLKENSDLRIVYDRNPENIGGIKNILHLWDKTSGDYVIMIGDDSFAKGGLSNLYSTLKENENADIIILKNNTYTDFEYKQNASMADVVKHIDKLHYIGNFILKRSHFGIKFNDYKIDYNNAYPHVILIMEKIMSAQRVVDTRFVAINIAISWNFEKTTKIIFKLNIDSLKIAQMCKNIIDAESYKMLVKKFNKNLYGSVRFIRAHKRRFDLLKYIWREIPVKNPKVMIAIVIHSLPAPIFYLFKAIDAIFKYFKSCIQEMRQNSIKWKEKDFTKIQDHIDDKFSIS